MHHTYLIEEIKNLVHRFLFILGQCSQLYKYSLRFNGSKSSELAVMPSNFLLLIIIDCKSSQEPGNRSCSNFGKVCYPWAKRKLVPMFRNNPEMVISALFFTSFRIKWSTSFTVKRKDDWLVYYYIMQQPLRQWNKIHIHTYIQCCVHAVCCNGYAFKGYEKEITSL